MTGPQPLLKTSIDQFQLVDLDLDLNDTNFRILVFSINIDEIPLYMGDGPRFTWNVAPRWSY